MGTLDLNLKLKSKEMRKGANNGEKKIVKEAMNLKLQDEKKLNRELTKERNILRAKIYELWNGRRAGNIVKRLRLEAIKVRKQLKTKYEKKIEHLKGKYGIDEEKKIDEVPEGLEEYEN